MFTRRPGGGQCNLYGLHFVKSAYGKLDIAVTMIDVLVRISAQACPDCNVIIHHDILHLLTMIYHQVEPNVTFVHGTVCPDCYFINHHVLIKTNTNNNQRKAHPKFAHLETECRLTVKIKSLKAHLKVRCKIA